MKNKFIALELVGTNKKYGSKFNQSTINKIHKRIKFRVWLVKTYFISYQLYYMVHILYHTLWFSLFSDPMKQEDRLTEKMITDCLKQLWKCLTGDHKKCNDGCKGKTGGKKFNKPLIRVESLRQFRKKIDNKIVRIESKPDDLYKSLFTDWLLSPGWISDIMNAAPGSHIEAFHQSIFAREIIIKNHPINTVYRGNKVSIWGQNEVKLRSKMVKSI